MKGDIEELCRLREKVVRARVAALRLGEAIFASLLAKSIIGIDLTIAELDVCYARTRPQVEALKRLVGAT